MVFLNTVLYADKKGNGAGGYRVQCNDDKTCDSFRTSHNNFITDYLTGNSNVTPNLVVTHVAPYQTDLGYNDNTPITLNNGLFDSNSRIIAGHWHLYKRFTKLDKLNGASGVAIDAITYRHGVKPGFVIYNFDGAEIHTERHYCVTGSISDLSGTTANPVFHTCSS